MSDDAPKPALPAGVVRASGDAPTEQAPLAAKRNDSPVGDSGGHTARITAIEPQERRKNRVNVFVDGRFALGLFEEVSLSLGLRVGQAITTERLNEIAHAETLRRAKEDAYRLLGFRARSEKEIEDRLRRKGYEDDVVAEVIGSLRAFGYLNDSAFARSWVASRGATRGRRALAHELRQKGIAPELAAETLDAGQNDESERAAALAAAVKRVGERPADSSREARARLAAFLQRRGFGWDVVRLVLAELYATENLEDTDDT